MYRRRRPQREKIAFSFDSFLDVVANVIGIIVRLILVAWVGARSYSAAMTWTAEEPPPGSEVADIRSADEPLKSEIEKALRDLDEARALLQAQLARLGAEDTRIGEARAQLAALTERHRHILAEANRAEARRDRGTTSAEALALDELRRRGARLVQELRALAAQPAPAKELRYHAPVSREVALGRSTKDQLVFECRAGRVTFINLPALHAEAEEQIPAVRKELEWRHSVTETTRPVGAFRLRCTYEALAGRGARTLEILEPINDARGETAQRALAAGSEFRFLTDRLDAQFALVTFWVYPDSFALFRELREHLYRRRIEVAARPLPPGAPIGYSPYGTASRGQ